MRTTAREMFAIPLGRLRTSWNNTVSDWRDDVAAEFERSHIDEIERGTRQFIDRCERFQELLGRAEAAIRELE